MTLEVDRDERTSTDVRPSAVLLLQGTRASRHVMTKAVTTLALALAACVAGYQQPQAPPSHSTRRRALAGLLAGPATAATAWVASARAEEKFQLDPGAKQVCLRRGLLG